MDYAGVCLVLFCILCFGHATYNGNRMIKQLVSNTSIFAQKSIVFDGPLPSRATPPRHYSRSGRRGVTVKVH